MKVAALRIVAAPVWLAFALVVLALSPVIALAGRAGSAASGRPEPLAVARLLLVYVTGELAFLAAAARGAGRDEVRELLGRFLDDIVRTAMSTLRLRIDVAAEPGATAALEDHGRPVLVFSRHAGGGDSVVLVHLLLCRFGREPGLVLKDLLAVDPLVGVVMRRLPCAPIDGGGDDASDAVRDLARRLAPSTALLMFPEGGNFTSGRRKRAIRWLHRRGQHHRARRAEALEHMLSPRPGGVLAALEGAPGADVLFTAHTGLGRAARGLSLLRGLPRDATVRVRLWHVPVAQRPDGEQAAVGWLDDWWARLDDWVAAQGED